MPQPPTWRDSGFEKLDVPLIVVAVTRQIVFANAAAHRLFGAAPGVLEGAGLERLVVAERRGELRNVEDVLAGGGARRVRSVVRREDGTRLDVAMAVEPCVDTRGRVEAASVRYEVIASSARMSGAPGVRMSVSPPRGGLSMPPRNSGVKPAQEPATTSRRSQPRLTRTPSEHEMRLHNVERSLQWLEERLSQPPAAAPLDDSRERARVLLVVTEARAQLRQSLEDLEQLGVNDLFVPAPPKVPTL